MKNKKTFKGGYYYTPSDYIDPLLKKAIEEDPSGINCFWCGEVNDFYDSIGWFYITPYVTKKDTGPCCTKCWEGKLGRKHVEKYGLGDR